MFDALITPGLGPCSTCLLPETRVHVRRAYCPRFGSMFDVRAGYYPMAPLDRKSLHGSMSALGVPPAAPPPPMGPPYMPPPHLMPPMMRPRPYVFPAEPLPTRDPFRPKTPVLQPPKLEQDYYSVDQVRGTLFIFVCARWCKSPPNLNSCAMQIHLCDFFIYLVSQETRCARQC